MRIAKIVSRTSVTAPTQVGVQNGKMFFDNMYEDGTYRKPAPSSVYEVFNGQRFPLTGPKEVQCAKAAVRLQNTYVTAIRYPSISGHSLEEYVSTRGTTRGRRYRSQAGRIIDDRDEVLYEPANTYISNSSSPYGMGTTTTVPSANVCRIIHETDLEFVVYCAGGEDTNGCLLMYILKSSKAATVVLTGQFSIHKLGKSKLSAERPDIEHTQFLVMLGSRLGYNYWNSSWGAEFNPRYTDVGSRVLVVGFINNSRIHTDPFGFWTRTLLTMGPGPIATSDNRYSLCNQRFVVDADESMVETDSDGYLIGFSFVAQNPSLVVEDQLVRSSSSTLNVKLNDNLCLFRVTREENRAFNVAHTKITIPEDYLNAVWTMYGAQNANGGEHISLVSGKAFSVVENKVRHVCVFLDNLGFEQYMHFNASNNAWYSFRKQPTLDPVLIKIPVNEAFLPLADATPVVHRFPARFGENIREISMLLRKNNTELVIPSMMYMRTDQTIYAGIDGQNKIAIVNVLTGSHQVIDIAPIKPMTTAYNTAVGSVGIVDDKLIVIDANDDVFILDDGPSVNLRLPGIVYEEDTHVTVEVDAPAQVTLFAHNGRFENGSNSITVGVQDTLDVPVYARDKLRIHATKCVALEASSEEV